MEIQWTPSDPETSDQCSFWRSRRRFHFTTSMNLFGSWRQGFQGSWEWSLASKNLSQTKGFWGKDISIIPRKLLTWNVNPFNILHRTINFDKIQQNRNIFFKRYFNRYARTVQLGQGTKRRPEIIDNFDAYKSVVGGKIGDLLREGPDKYHKPYTP